jgi:hypothetical protein
MTTLIHDSVSPTKYMMLLDCGWGDVEYSLTLPNGAYVSLSCT